VLQGSLAAPIGVDVRNLPDPYRLLGVLLAQGEPPYVGPKRQATLTPYRAKQTPPWAKGTGAVRECLV
jgi:hypothetical protein